MPVVFQKFITRQDIKNNPQNLYVFGDNLQRAGLGGQAKEMRGEKNSVGLPTKKSPSPTGFLSNDDFDEVLEASEEDEKRLIAHLKSGGVVIWPEDGIGTGLAQLRDHAPAIFEFYTNLLEEFKGL